MIHLQAAEGAFYCGGELLPGGVPSGALSSQLVADVTCVHCLFQALTDASQQGREALRDEHEGDVRQAVHQVRDLSTTLLLVVTRW